MAKRSSSTQPNKPFVDEEFVNYPVTELGIDPPSRITYNKVVNLTGSRVIRYVNGHRYEWQPGQSIPVLLEDTQELLSLRFGGASCCGGTRTNQMFELSED